jgi:hypothetical protein
MRSMISWKVTLSGQMKMDDEERISEGVTKFISLNSKSGGYAVMRSGGLAGSCGHAVMRSAVLRSAVLRS